MDDMLTLIGERVIYDEIGAAQKEETRRDILIRTKSVTSAEWYRAGLAGRRPEIVCVTNAVNYDGETSAEVRGCRYTIYRTWRDPNGDEIELYLEKRGSDIAEG